MKIENKIINCIWLICGFLTVLGIVKSIFISFDIDEAYAIAQSYRLAIGDKLVLDMWEPHQFSAFFSTLFIKLFISFFGTVEYLVIFLRTVGVIIHILIGLILYIALKHDINPNISKLILFLHINFLPKWIQMPEFELMHYWGLVLCFISLYKYGKSGKNRLFYAVGCGMSFALCVFCYPTCLILYIIYGLYILVCEIEVYKCKGISRFTGLFVFTITSALIGISFIIYLLSYMSVGELIKNLSYIFLDVSHTTYTKAQQWGRYLEQITEQIDEYGLIIIYPVAILLFALLIFIIIRKLTLKKGNRKESEAKKLIGYIEPVIIFALAISDIILQFQCAFGMLFDDKNQFFLQFRYLILILPAVYLGIKYFKILYMYFGLMIVPAIASLFAVLFVTNMDTNVSYAKMFIGILGSIIIYSIYFSYIIKEPVCSKLGGTIVYMVAFSLLLTLFICRIVMIRVSGCNSVTVKAPLKQMEMGAEKGLYIHKDTANVWNNNYNELSTYVDEEDKLLYIGAENMIYVFAGCKLATPSTQGTTVFNEMFQYYYEEHPDRIPTLIVIDKTYKQIDAYASSYLDQFIYDWVEENYKDCEHIETDFMTIIKVD